MANGKENVDTTQMDYAQVISEIYSPETQSASATGLNALFTNVLADSTFSYNPHDSVYTPTERIIDNYANMREQEMRFQIHILFIMTL